MNNVIIKVKDEPSLGLRKEGQKLGHLTSKAILEARITCSELELHDPPLMHARLWVSAGREGWVHMASPSPKEIQAKTCLWHICLPQCFLLGWPQLTVYMAEMVVTGAWVGWLNGGPIPFGQIEWLTGNRPKSCGGSLCLGEGLNLELSGMVCLHGG